MAPTREVVVRRGGRPRRGGAALLGTAALVVALAAAGCSSGSSNTESSSVDATTSNQPSATSAGGSSGTSSTTAGGTAAGTGEFPCSLLSQTQVEQLAGNPLDKGSAATNHTTENDVEYVAEACTWSASGSDPAVEVTVAVSRASDFPSGSVECPPLLGADSSVSGLGGPASWSWTGTGSTVEKGVLRVCESTSLVTVTVRGPGTEPAIQQIARDVETQVAATL